MGEYEIKFTRRAKKDVEKLSPKIKKKLKDILVEVIAQDPFRGKKLSGDLKGSYTYPLTYI
ncbi:MAG: hypothetical protein A2Y65_12850 [Deltaproteobacteria bacterium RBG_13_52_11]|nr:MAG: hypothetical protein A2Y65_12850 [Deltaproteobacteria bacterium RBG_13_52_11]